MSPSRLQTIVPVLAALAIVLLATNIVLGERNRVAQTEVNQRTQFIQQTVQLERVQREIISTIVNVAVRNNDDALRTLLTQHGITINPPGGTPPPAGPTR